MGNLENEDYGCNMKPNSSNCKNPIHLSLRELNSFITEEEIKEMGLVHSPRTNSFKKPRPIMFIDLTDLVSYFSERRMRPNYKELKRLVREEYGNNLDLRIYGSASDPISVDHRKFFNYLKKNDYDLTMGRLGVANVPNSAGNMVFEKETEVKLAVDMISLAFNKIIEDCVLITRDEKDLNGNYIGKYEAPVNILQKKLRTNVVILDPSQLNNIGNLLNNKERGESIRGLYRHLLNSNPQMDEYRREIRNDLRKYTYNFLGQKESAMIFIDFYNVITSFRTLKRLAAREPNTINKMYPNVKNDSIQGIRNLKDVEFIELLKNYFRKSYTVNETYIFMGLHPRRTLDSRIYENQLRYIGEIESQGNIVKHKDNEVLENGNEREKGIDIMMASYSVLNAYQDNYSKGIFLTGDSDLSEAIRKIKDLGKEFEIWSFSGDESSYLVSEFGTRWINGILGLGSSRGCSPRD